MSDSIVAVAVKRRQEFETQLSKLAPRLGQLLPPRAGDPHRFVRMVGLAVLKNPGLLEPDVDRASLAMAILTLAEMGLGPGPLAHLVPFRGPKGKKYVVPIPDYKGLIDVALASGKVASFDTGCIYENDRWRYVKGSAPSFEHEPSILGTAAERGRFIAAYSIAYPYIAGDVPPWVTVLMREEIETIRNASRGYQFALNNGTDSPWLDAKKPGEFRPGTPSAEMAIKTAVRRQYKLLPKTAEMLAVERVDNDADDMTPPVTDDMVSQILDLRPEPSDTSDMETERKRLVSKLIEYQQRHQSAFGEIARSFGLEPTVKIESLSLDGLAAIEEALDGGAR